MGNKLLNFDNYFACGFDLCSLLEALYCTAYGMLFVHCPEFRGCPYIAEVENLHACSLAIGSTWFIHCIEVVHIQYLEGFTILYYTIHFHILIISCCWSFPGNRPLLTCILYPTLHKPSECYIQLQDNPLGPSPSTQAAAIYQKAITMTSALHIYFNTIVYRRSTRTNPVFNEGVMPISGMIMQSVSTMNF